MQIFFQKIWNFKFKLLQAYEDFVIYSFCINSFITLNVNALLLISYAILLIPEEIRYTAYRLIVNKYSRNISFLVVRSALCVHPIRQWRIKR